MGFGLQRPLHHRVRGAAMKLSFRSEDAVQLGVPEAMAAGADDHRRKRPSRHGQSATRPGAAC
jgi:hypothetical protein